MTSTEFCRKRKIKCDGIAPCSGCTRFGRPTECSILYEEASSQGRSYVSYLEDRIAKLAQHPSSHAINQSDTSSVSMNNIHPQWAQPVESSTSRQTQNNRVVSEEEPAKALAGESPDKLRQLAQELRSLDSNSAAVLTNQSLHTPWDFRTSILSFIGYKDETGPYLSPMSRATVQPLVHHYTSKVSPAFPFVLVSDIVRAQERFHNEQATTNERFMILMVMAIAASHMSEHPSSMASWNALRFFSSASYEARYDPNSLTGLELTMLIIQFASLNPSKAHVWYLSNLAMRTCASLNLHQQIDKPEIAAQSESAEPEIQDRQAGTGHLQSLAHTRSRLFWAAYAYDRSVSITTGRPLGFDDDIITTPVVPSLPQLQLEPNRDLMYQRIFVFRILSEIYTKFYSNSDGSTELSETLVPKLERKINQWVLHNPILDEPLLNADLYTAQVLLYRPCPALPDRSGADLVKLAEASINYIDQLYESMHGPVIVYNSNFIITRIYTAGLAVMHVCSNSKFDRDSLDGVMLSRINLAVSKATSCLFGATAKWQVDMDLATRFVQIQGPFYAWLNSGGSIESLADEILGFSRHRPCRLKRNLDEGAPDWDQVMHTLLSASENINRQGGSSPARNWSDPRVTQDQAGAQIPADVVNYTPCNGEEQQRLEISLQTTYPGEQSRLNNHHDGTLSGFGPQAIDKLNAAQTARYFSPQPTIRETQPSNLTPLQQLAHTAIRHPRSTGQGG